MGMTRPLALAVLALMAVSGCAAQEPVKPRAFDAVSTAVPAGWHEELCPGDGFTVRLVVPDEFRWSHHEGRACGWPGREFDSGLSVVVGPTDTLAHYRKKYLDPYESDDGDDAVNHIAYDDGVTVLGDEDGERLDWYSFDDGAPSDERALQGAGVRVTWSTPAGGDKRREDLQTLLDSIAVLPGEHDQCRRGGIVARYELPEVVEGVESAGGTCRFSLRDAVAPEQHAELVLAPNRTLEQYAAEVRGQRGTRNVRLEKNAAELAGKRVDRLSWQVVRTDPGPNDDTVGAWRIEVVGDERVRVEWGATPKAWDEERATVQRFLASVRLP